MDIDFSRRPEQVVILTRMNAWLVPTTVRIARNFAVHGVKLAGIVYTGVTEPFVRGRNVAAPLKAMRAWNDEYFETKFIPWVDGLKSASKSPLVTVTPTFQDLSRTFRAEVRKVDVGDKGRLQYHSLLAERTKNWTVPTLVISNDTRLKVDDETLGKIVHIGLHPGRFKPQDGFNVRALGDCATIKMFLLGQESTLHGAIHVLSPGLDQGHVADQCAIVPSKTQSMFEVRRDLYDALTTRFNMIANNNILCAHNLRAEAQDVEAPKHPDIEESLLIEHLPGFSAEEKVPHPRLMNPVAYLRRLAEFLPDDVSIRDIPEPESIGITQDMLARFEA